MTDDRCFIEIAMGHVEHVGPFRNRAAAMVAVRAFEKKVAERPDAEWWAMDATNHNRPSAHVITLRNADPIDLLEQHLADWELPV